MSTILDQIKARKAAELAKVADKVGLVQAPNPTPAAIVTVAASSMTTVAPTTPPASAPSDTKSSPLKSILARNIGNVSPLAKALAEIKQAPGPKPQVQAKPLVEAPITQSAPAKISADQAAKFEAARQQLKQDILFLKNNMQNLPVIKDAVTAIFKQVKAMPDLQIVMDVADFEITMEAFKRSYQLAARTRTEKRETKAAKNRQGDEFARALTDMGIVL